MFALKNMQKCLYNVHLFHGIKFLINELTCVSDPVTLNWAVLTPQVSPQAVAFGMITD